MSAENLQCWKCGETLAELIFPVSRREECAACRAQIHVCRMCRHYRSRNRDWCSEDRAEPPAAPDTANFCDYFAITGGAWTDAAGTTDAARQQLDSLFGAGSADDPTPDASDDLKALFGDD